MLKIATLASVAVMAVNAGAASTGQFPSATEPRAALGSNMHPQAGLTTLWNQNSADSNSINSQNYTSGAYTSDNSAGADDFVIPKGQVWTIDEVDVSGVDSYYPVASMNITFYKNHKGTNGSIDTPGKMVKHGSLTGVSCAESGSGNYDCTPPVGKKYPKLKAGHYWVSVVANDNYLSSWSWSENATITGDSAEWENPGGGWSTSCTTWNTIANCTGTAGDLAFDLQGTSR